MAGRESDLPVFVHDADRDEVTRVMAVRGGFTKRHKLGSDFEVIPMPGHTPGSTAYLWDSGHHRFLFTADSLYLGGDGRWRAAVLESSDRERYVRSLELLRDLEFDVLVPWAAPADGPVRGRGQPRRGTAAAGPGHRAGPRRRRLLAG